jgi:NADH:ubiquinone oxidoreductase subunit 2 (subunit N)
MPFVGEFLLYSFLFAIHPALAVAAIFAGLVCFLFYFRICYTLMVRKSKEVIPLPLPVKLAAAVLSGLVVALGIMPQVLLKILEMVA